MLDKGDKVQVRIPEDIAELSPLREFDKGEFVVKKVCHCRGAGAGYSELEGAESKMGMPYAFLNEWLLKI